MKKIGPLLHQFSTTLDRSTSTIRLLRFVLDSVRQCTFDQLPGVIGTVSCPIAESRSKPMNCNVTMLHPAKQHTHGHVAASNPIHPKNFSRKLDRFLFDCVQQ